MLPLTVYLLPTIFVILAIAFRLVERLIYFQKILNHIKYNHPIYWKENGSPEPKSPIVHTPIYRYLMINHKKLPQDKELLGLAKIWRFLYLAYFVCFVFAVLYFYFKLRFFYL